MNISLGFLHTAEIRTVTCVNLNSFALVDEERNTDFDTCLKCCRLRGVGGCVTLDARFAVGNLQIGLNWHFGIEPGSVGGVGANIHDVTFFHEVNTCNQIFGDRHLLISLLVHEYIASRVLIQVLVRTAFDAYIFQFESNLERTVEDTACGYALQLGAHNRIALSWFYVQKLYANVNLTIKTDTCPVFDLL